MSHSENWRENQVSGIGSDLKYERQSKDRSSNAQWDMWMHWTLNNFCSALLFSWNYTFHRLLDINPKVTHWDSILLVFFFFSVWDSFSILSIYVFKFTNLFCNVSLVMKPIQGIFFRYCIFHLLKFYFLNFITSIFLLICFLLNPWVHL